MGAEWITHKGKKIIYINYADLKSDEMVKLVEKATQMIVDTKVNDNLVLTDVNNAVVSEEFMEAAKKNSKISLPLSKKSAIVGVTGMKKILLVTINRFSAKPRVPFDDLEKAKDWLVE